MTSSGAGFLAPKNRWPDIDVIETASKRPAQQARQPSLLPEKNTLRLAFHLPQFHPIPENDAWWGKGFTEWTNVVRGRPQFRGHYQPHQPADLGYYDLRLPEAREQQAALAREAGLTGFAYYHYWFNGRRLLEKPVDDILALKKPDFPFCLCWANEPWSRNWDGQESQLLMPQAYSEADDLAHIRWLLEAFADERYIKIDGRPLFLVYRPSGLPDMVQTADRWRREAENYGFPGLYLASVQAFPRDSGDPRSYGLDAAVEFRPNGTPLDVTLHSDNPLDIGFRIHRVMEYDAMVRWALTQDLPNYAFFPGVCPSWDNTVRRKENALIFRDSTPEKYGEWLRQVLIRETLRQQKPSIVFVNAWNEWAEGNHLEPCQRWGRAYLDATRDSVAAAENYRAAVNRLRPGERVRLSPDYRVKGFVDRLNRDTAEITAEGWCIEIDSGTPPDVFVLAAGESDGTYRILSPLADQRRPRPDVAQKVSESGLLSGWKVAAAETPNEKLGVLALRLRDQAFSLVTPLERIGSISHSEVSSAIPAAAERPAEGDPSKPVLFISHDFAAAGAQLLLMRFVLWLRKIEPSFPFETLINAPRSAASRASADEDRVLKGFREAGTVHFISDSTGLPENLEQLRSGHYGLIYANTSTLGPLLESIPSVKTPVLSHIHELGFWIEKRTGRAAFQLQADRTARFIACSTPVREYLVDRLGVSAEKVELIHESASTERARETRAKNTRESVRQELGLPADAFVVAACGTYDWRKGAELFVPICVALRRKLAGRDFRAIWIGAYGGQIVKDQFDHEAEVAGLEGKVRLIGPQQDPYRWILAADCFALPSREDPFPLVMLEAATLGLPIVGFQDSGGVEEFTENGAGILVPYLDLEGFAGALARLAADPELAAKLGTEAADRVARHYDQEKSFQRTHELILRLALP